MSRLRNRLRGILKPISGQRQGSTASRALTDPVSTVPRVDFIDGRASYISANNDGVGRSIQQGRAWGRALAAGTMALGECERLLAAGLKGQDARLAHRLKALLEAQVDELRDILPFTGNPRSSAMTTLRDVYHKIYTTLQTAGPGDLGSLIDVLHNGPDYLIDVGILENLLWHAEVIDPGLGADARAVLDDAIRGHANDPDTFRRAGQSFIALSSSVPRDVTDDGDAQEAYKAIGTLIIHLQARVGDSTTASRVASRLASTLASPAISPIASPSISRAPTPENDLEFTKYSDATSLEAAFGTGPIPSSTSVSRQVSSTATPQSPPSPTDTEASQEIWEYRGNLLTRSALSLVLRQEALAMADSSGQYAGEVSWDNVRQAYIPKWAEKLKPEEVVEGEIPTTNPAEYRVRRRDAWGNDIGWRDGVMFYKNEPSFDSPA